MPRQVSAMYRTALLLFTVSVAAEAADVPRVGPGGVRALLRQVDGLASEQCTRNVVAQWRYETDVGEETQLAALSAQAEYSHFQRAVWDLLKTLKREDVGDPDLWRQVRLLSVVGPAALPLEKLERYNRLINDMLAIYNSANVCAYRDPFHCGLRLDPDLTQLMARSRDWEELEHAWTEWRRLTGPRMRPIYEEVVELTNEAARLNNLTDGAELWMFPYESPTLKLEVEEVWEEVRPLYEQLHAYVRRKLRDHYGPDKINRHAPLPAHVLGNMWAQTWSNILDITLPYPGKHFLDVTPQMIEQGYTPASMFQLADHFFISLNLSAAPPEFWSGSLLEEIRGRPVVCQPSAWDFCNGKDFRIKMCTRVNLKDLVTAHHEMGHLQYFLQYRHLPKVYRDGANPGFHEAVGEAVALSVATPRHLRSLGLLRSSPSEDSAHDINFLFALALDKVAFLPFALALDRWRWDIFRESVAKSRYNCHWWRLREQYSGIKPPVLRSEGDFDPGSKYHVPANVPYIRYFVGTILQFQLHRTLCKRAGQYSPENSHYLLHQCDIHGSKAAGEALGNMMALGASHPWPDALRAATGGEEYKLSASALRDYFRPLEDWLRQENLRTQEPIGWTYDGDYCKQSIETAGLQVYGGYYNEATSTSFVLITSLIIPIISSFLIW
ncbi:angiotensin-converting enzyme [Hetaerina americana]|uniref:angiotensin-converting enzyme n=1 Tax=Hetaerina americana TaxID=62018 RepID=UPI003A7F36E3